MSNYYPSSNSWEDKGSYQVKHKFEDGVCTHILYARAGLTAREADDDHIHIGNLGEDDQFATYRNKRILVNRGRIQGNLSDHEIQEILNGGDPLFSFKNSEFLLETPSLSLHITCRLRVFLAVYKISN